MIVYLIISAIGIIIYFIVIDKMVNSLVLDHDIRTRMRLELTQEINNIYQASKTIEISQRVNSFRPISSKNNLLSCDLGRQTTRDFAFFLDHIVGLQASQSGVLYNFYFDPKLFSSVIPMDNKMKTIIFLSNLKKEGIYLGEISISILKKGNLMELDVSGNSNKNMFIKI